MIVVLRTADLDIRIENIGDLRWNGVSFYQVSNKLGSDQHGKPEPMMAEPPMTAILTGSVIGKLLSFMLRVAYCVLRIA